MSNSFYEKQMVLGRLGLPSDIVREIKNFCFEDIVLGESKKIKNKCVAILNTALSRENKGVYMPYAIPDIVYHIGGQRFSHWGYGFIQSNERVQMQAMNCMHCGDYHLHSGMNTHNYSDRIYCQCSLYEDIIFEDEMQLPEIFDELNDYYNDTFTDNEISDDEP